MAYDIFMHVLDDYRSRPGGIGSMEAQEEIILFQQAFEDSGFAPLPVQFLSQAAFADTIDRQTVYALEPADFLGGRRGGV